MRGQLKDASGEPVTDYVIPEKVENGGVSYSVTAIGEEAFHWSDLKSVTLPQTIESIKRSAFNTARNLTSITLPAGLKHIGEYAFDYAGLTSIKIPDSVEGTTLSSPAVRLPRWSWAAV